MNSVTDRRLAVAKLNRLSVLRPRLGIVLGSGFHHVTERLDLEARISYRELPGFPPVGVSELLPAPFVTVPSPAAAH